MEIVKKIIDFFMDILETVVFVGSIFIVLYLFVVAPNQVKGASMDTTFRNGEYILTSKIGYKFGHPKQGDVVVFASLANNEIDFIKRIIGLPSDRILVKDGKVYVNGKMLHEDYISAKTSAFEGGFIQDGVEVTVPDGHLFVMGDNRPRSSDSREFGFIPIANIIGKVIYRYFPANRIGPIRNPYESMLMLHFFSTRSVSFVRV